LVAVPDTVVKLPTWIRGKPELADQTTAQFVEVLMVTTKLDVVTTVVSGSALVGPEVRNTETTGV
jgi:hypothetical protein